MRRPRAFLHALPFLLLAGGFAAPAAAQQYDPFDKLGSVEAADNPFGRDRNVSVADRPRPDYATVPIRAGRFEITPQLVTETTYDDNIYAVSDPRTGDAIVTVRPRLAIARPDPNLALSLAGEYEATRYLDNGSENRNDYTIEGRALSTVRRDTVAQLRLLQARISEDRTSPDSPSGIVRPNRSDLSEAYGEVAHIFNRLRLTGSIDYQRRNYIDNHNPAGEEIDQDFRDHSILTSGAIAEYGLSPSLALFAAGSINRRDYRQRVDGVPARDSSGFELAAGANFELGHLMRGSLRLGYLKQDYADPYFNDVSGLLVRGELAYFVTPLVTITGKVDRSVAETGVVGAAGYLRTRESLRVDYELLRNLILRAEGGLEQRDFNNIERKDDRLTGSFSASYLISHRWALRAEYSHRGQSSSGSLPGREFDENRVTVGLVFKGL